MIAGLTLLSALLLGSGLALAAAQTLPRWQQRRARRYRSRWWLQNRIETAALYTAGAAVIAFMLMLVGVFA